MPIAGAAHLGASPAPIATSASTAPRSWRAEAEPSTEIADLAGIGSLRGAHNAQNALRAPARRCCRCPSRCRPPTIARWPADVSRPAAPHGGDRRARRARCSSTTARRPTPTPTEKALASFPGDIYWIVGGKAKTGGIASLAEHFPRIAKAYLIGEATEDFAATLDGQVAFERCGTLDAAVARRPRDAAALPTRASRSCCCRRPARPTTSSGTSRCAATPSARSSPRCPASCIEAGRRA